MIKKIFMSVGMALLVLAAAGSAHTAFAWSDGGPHPAGSCPADKVCEWIDVQDVTAYGASRVTSNGENFYNDGATADHLCQLRGYDSYTYQATLGSYSKCNNEISVTWNGSGWNYFGCTSSKWLSQIYCAKTAPNDPPTISWSSAPASAQCNASYYIEATGRDTDGNLTAVSIDKDGVPFAYASTGYSPATTVTAPSNGSGGSGKPSRNELLNFNNIIKRVGSELADLVKPLKALADTVFSYSSGNPTSDQGPKTVTFTAWADDARGAKSNVISHTVTIGSCTVTPPEVKGCTNPSATNYNPNATVDDGSCVAPAHNPVGWLDSAACDAFNGWASDADSPDSAISVHFYADGNFVGATDAGAYRSDVGSHGFSFATPASLKDGSSHRIDAYGINLGGGSNALLSGSGKTIQCQTVVVPQTTPSGYISVSPSTLPAGGGSVNVSWATSNASSCSASGAWSGSKGTSGSENVSVANTSTFNISCSGSGGSWNGAGTVTVTAAPAVCRDSNATNFGGTLPCNYTPVVSTCQDANATNYGGSLPCTYGNNDNNDNNNNGGGNGDNNGSGNNGGNNGGNNNGNGNGNANGGNGNGNVSTAGFTVTADKNQTSIQFLGTVGATSSPRTIDINPVNNFSSPVTLHVSDIRSTGGAAVPNGTAVTYSFDGTAGSNPSTTLTYNSQVGRYMGEQGGIGTTFTVNFSKPITESYVITFQGAGGGTSATYALTVDPRAANPNFQEL